MVGGLLEALQLILVKQYVAYIIIFFTNIQNPLVNIPPARFTTKILFKALQCNIGFYSENDQPKVKKQTTTGRNAFWFSVVAWVSASSI